MLPEPWSDDTRKRFFDTFSDLSLNGRDDELVEALKPLEPRLKRILLNTKGMWPALFANLGSGRAQMLNMLGDGMTRLVGYLLSIEAQRGGVVLIDEVENGFHHEVMVDVWRAVLRWARVRNVQVIATTHSYECIRAAHEAFSEAPDDLRLIRLQRFKDGNVRPITFQVSQLDASLSMNAEVR